MYLVFTRLPGESYHRQLGSLALCLHDISRALINSFVEFSLVSKLCSGAINRGAEHRRAGDVAVHPGAGECRRPLTLAVLHHHLWACLPSPVPAAATGTGEKLSLIWRERKRVCMCVCMGRGVCRGLYVHAYACVCACISTNLVLVLATQEDSMHKRKQKSQSQSCARTHMQGCFMVCVDACLSMHVCLHVYGWAWRKVSFVYESNKFLWRLIVVQAFPVPSEMKTDSFFFLSENLNFVFFGFCVGHTSSFPQTQKLHYYETDCW